MVKKIYEFLKKLLSEESEIKDDIFNIQNLFPLIKVLILKI